MDGIRGPNIGGNTTRGRGGLAHPPGPSAQQTSINPVEGLALVEEFDGEFAGVLSYTPRESSSSYPPPGNALHTTGHCASSVVSSDQEDETEQSRLLTSGMRSESSVDTEDRCAVCKRGPRDHTPHQRELCIKLYNDRVDALRSLSSDSRGSSREFKGKCNLCGKPGHKKAQCRSRTSTRQSKASTLIEMDARNQRQQDAGASDAMRQMQADQVEHQLEQHAMEREAEKREAEAKAEALLEERRYECIESMQCIPPFVVDVPFETAKHHMTQAHLVVLEKGPLWASTIETLPDFMKTLALKANGARGSEWPVYVPDESRFDVGELFDHHEPYAVFRRVFVSHTAVRVESKNLSIQNTAVKSTESLVYHRGMFKYQMLINDKPTSELDQLRRGYGSSASWIVQMSTSQAFSIEHFMYFNTLCSDLNLSDSQALTKINAVQAAHVQLPRFLVNEELTNAKALAFWWFRHQKKRAMGLFEGVSQNL